MIHDDQEQDETDEKGGLSQPGTRAYSSAMEAVFTIPIATVLGWYADSWLGTEPWLLFIFLGLGFWGFVLRLMKMRKLVEQAAEEHKNDDVS